MHIRNAHGKSFIVHSVEAVFALSDVEFLMEFAHAACWVCQCFLLQFRA